MSIAPYKLRKTEKIVNCNTVCYLLKINDFLKICNFLTIIKLLDAKATSGIEKMCL